MLSLSLAHTPAVHPSLAVLGTRGFPVALVSLSVQAELVQAEGWGPGGRVGQVGLCVQDLHALL